MLAIEVELLTGRYVATAFNDRDRAEWPPHPARLFSALVAALHEDDPADVREREALEWLERQPAPSLAVDDEARVGRRRVLDVYVPVNDVSLLGDVEAPVRQAAEHLRAAEQRPAGASRTKAVKDASKAFERESAKLRKKLAEQQVVDQTPSKSDLVTAAALVPDRRTRQVRTFPVVVPEHPTFTFVWSESPPLELRRALDRVCARVTRLGHSSSLVRCAVLDDVPPPTLVPDEVSGSEVLRTTGPGQLRRLEQEHARHRGVESRVLPYRPQRYGKPRPAASDDMTTSVFSNDWIVFERVGGARPLSSRTVDLTRALRGALLEQHGTRDLPTSLSGHGPDGRAAGVAHVAFLALPFVGSEHADGSVKAVAAVFPRDVPPADRQALLRLVAQWELTRSAADGSLTLAAVGLPETRVRRADLPATWSARPSSWCGVGRRFVTATPIALDRNPGNLRSNLERAAHRAAAEAERSIAEACERVVGRRPISAEVSFAPMLQGAQPSYAFRALPKRPGRPARVCVHADIRFDCDVRGPLLVGAGRYFGLGLCLPAAG